MAKFKAMNRIWGSSKFQIGGQLLDVDFVYEGSTRFNMVICGGYMAEKNVPLKAHGAMAEKRRK